MGRPMLNRTPPQTFEDQGSGVADATACDDDGHLLGDLLDAICIRDAAYVRSDFHGAVGLATPGTERAALLYLVVEGCCHLRVESGAGAVLAAGDLALIPGGRPHLLATGETLAGMAPDEARASALARTGQPIIVGDSRQERTCRAICGRLNFADVLLHPLLQAAPDLLLIRGGERGSHLILDDVVQLIERRMAGGEAMPAESMTRLSEVLFIEALRIGVTQAGDLARLVATAHDRQVSRAKALIHEDLGAPWTVERLAKAVCMSRSRFARRFRDLVGVGPMTYVAEQRLQQALRLLQLQNAPVKVVAAAVGFRSPASFTRAFAERFGYPPSRLERALTSIAQKGVRHVVRPLRRAGP
jgi:AraC family transcriptional activator of mtrCDE